MCLAYVLHNQHLSYFVRVEHWTLRPENTVLVDGVQALISALGFFLPAEPKPRAASGVSVLGLDFP